MARNPSQCAQTSLVIYYTIEIAKENGFKPFEELRRIFERMPNIPQGDYLPASLEQFPAGIV